MLLHIEGGRNPGKNRNDFTHRGERKQEGKQTVILLHKDGAENQKK